MSYPRNFLRRSSHSEHLYECFFTRTCLRRFGEHLLSLESDMFETFLLFIIVSFTCGQVESARWYTNFIPQFFDDYPCAVDNP